MDNFNKVVQDLAKKAQKQQQDERIDIIVKIMSVLFDKAAAYTNIIIVAGYVAFFTVWSNMKTTLSEREMLLSAFCITLSLIFFIFWEVGKMIINSQSLRGLIEVINAPPDQFGQKLQEQQKAEQRLNINLIRAWFVVLSLTVVPGLIGAGVLLWSFGRQLINTA